MDKQSLIEQVEKIRQALNVISVSGYGNIKTFGNCMDAMTELSKNIQTYENDIQNMLDEQIKKIMESTNMMQLNNEQSIVPVSPEKQKPKRIKQEVSDIGKN